jgi:DNA-binding transcriptional LysR family regulator
VSLTPEERYHVVIPAGRDPSPAARFFLDWLIEQITLGSED